MPNATYSFMIDWDNDGSFGGVGKEYDDVTGDVLGVRSPIEIQFGRDTPRSLAEYQPGELTLELNNDDQKYSPDNTGSTLFGKIGPGKPVRVQATHASVTYTLFRGYIDEYTLNPGPEDESVTITCLDLIQRIEEQTISTEVFQGKTTGELIGEVLDAVSWPSGSRDIDTGATCVRVWWEEGETAGEAIRKLVKSEGPPAIAMVDASGNFVFKDRSHRHVDTASISSQETFDATEFMAEGFEYDIGWADLINSMTVVVEEREPTFRQTVWQNESTITVASATNTVIVAESEEPFINAIAPKADVDYELLSGTISSITISRTTGQTTTITIDASATAQLRNLRLRATPLPVRREVTVSASDATSISKYGLRSGDDAEEMVWAGVHDAKAIVDRIIDLRKERLATVFIQLMNDTSANLTSLLNRDLSDCITITETAQTKFNSTAFIERIEHNIEDVGYNHSVRFGCEKLKYATNQSPTDVLVLGSDQLDQERLGT